MTQLRLSTNMFTVTKLHEICERKKKQVTIDQTVLMNLLLDHGRLYNAVTEHTSVEVITPPVDDLYYEGKNEKGKRVAKVPRVRLKQKKTEKPKPVKKRNTRIRLNKPNRIRL